MELGFRIVKIADICYVTVMYFIAGFLMAKLYDTIFPKFNEKEADNTHILYSVVDAVVRICINAITVYVARNIFELVPSPFNGLYGFQHIRLKELSGAATFSFALLYYQANFQSELKYIYNKVL